MMAPGDESILQALLEYRVLESGQLALITGRSSAVIRRAIRRRLESEGLVLRLSGGLGDQVAYCLSRNGLELMAGLRGLELGSLPFSAKAPAGPSSLMFRHTRLTNDVLIAFRKSCAGAEPVRLLAAVPEWHMHVDPRRRRGRKSWQRFALREMLEDIDEPRLVHSFRPDAMLLLEASSAPEAKAAAYLEADRCTESLSGPIQEKLHAYWHFFLRRGFEQHGAQAMRVLFVIGSARTGRRVAAMGETVLDFCRRIEPRHEAFRFRSPYPIPLISALVSCFRFCRAEDFADADITLDPIWSTAGGEKVPLFRGPASRTEPSLSINPTYHDSP
jgi:hypothetical protein